MHPNEFKKIEDHFQEHGWVVVPLIQKETLLETRGALLTQLRKITGNNDATLENYHLFVENGETHTSIQLQLTEFLRSNHLGKKIVAEQGDFFKWFIGRDLDIQKNPYLRITRPGKPQDNIGYHRDTYYGGPPFEVSVLIPFVHLEAKSSLSFLSGSHRRPEKDFPTVQMNNPDPAITKGSPKHKLGFLYAPKLIDPANLTGIQSVPIALGEMLIFSITTIHGSVENKGSHSRWSCDIRLINAFTPAADRSRSEYYEPFCRSVVTECTQTYIKINGEPDVS